VRERELVAPSPAIFGCRYFLCGRTSPKKGIATYPIACVGLTGVSLVPAMDRVDDLFPLFAGISDYVG
jgi:hypothetical protein